MIDTTLTLIAKIYHTIIIIIITISIIVNRNRNKNKKISKQIEISKIPAICITWIIIAVLQTLISFTIVLLSTTVLVIATILIVEIEIVLRILILLIHLCIIIIHESYYNYENGYRLDKIVEYIQTIQFTYFK